LKIAVLSDIHGDLSALNDASEILQQADITVIAGDLTRRGDLNELEYVVTSLKNYAKTIFAIPGNMDGVNASHILNKHGISLHSNFAFVDNIGFLGFGGSTPTPFGTPFEINESEIVASLNSSWEKLIEKKPTKTVVVCHNPPYNTAIDKVLLGSHVGSKGIRNFIEEKQPTVFLSGHIHEAVNTDKLGETVLLNPGPFRRKTVGLIDIPNTGQVTAKIIKVG